MPNEEHLHIFKQGVAVWNKWREKNPETRPDLSNVRFGGANLRDINFSDSYLKGLLFNNSDFTGAKLTNAYIEHAYGPDSDFRGADLRMANLTNGHLRLCRFNEADLRGAILNRSNLSDADFKGANLSRTNLNYTDLTDADLRGVNLREAGLYQAYLKGTDFRGADLFYADLKNAILFDTKLSGADLTTAEVAYTIFADVDLSEVKGLDALTMQMGPTSISIETLYRSGGRISDFFLRQCGVPEDFIVYARSLVGKDLDFYSCFISYSTKDEEFTKRLYSRMRDENLRVWFAPEDIKGGVKLYEQIERAIQLYDKLLIVLSEHSIQSEWVMTELRRARKAEIKEKRRKLFPITLANFEMIREWECFDADSGKDLAVEVREYFIPDFSNWKDHDSFEASFKRLLKDLRAAES